MSELERLEQLLEESKRISSRMIAVNTKLSNEIRKMKIKEKRKANERV